MLMDKNHWTWTIISVLLLFHVTSIAAASGVIRPDNPYGFVHEILNLTCEVTDPRITGDISGSLYFTNQQDGEERVISPQDVSVLDDRTVKLEYIVQSGEDQGPFICKLNQSDGQAIIVAKQFVTVEYRAASVQNIDCLVYNWEHMKCSWDLGREYVNKNLLQVELYWAIIHSQLCPNATMTSCTWGADDLHPDETYSMVVIVTTRNKSDVETSQNVSRIFTVNAQEIVKPTRVQNLTVVEETSTCITLSWQQSRKYRNFLYQMSWHGGHTQNNGSTRETNMTVCGLHPAVPYTFLVTSIPIPPGYEEPRGIYSDPTYLKVTTLEDAPSGAPIVHTGSFAYGKCTLPIECQVTVYWKSVPADDRNGEITAYNMTVWRSDRTSVADHWEVDGSSRSYLLTTLRPDTDYFVELRARTKVNYSEKSSCIFIPARLKKIPLPSHFLVEKTDSYLLVSWGPPAETETMPLRDIIGYTLYYCDGSGLSCRGEIQWQHLSSNQTQYQLNVPDGILDNKMIGISVEMETANQRVSSGIRWNTCIYHKHEKPPKVQNVRFPPGQPDHALRVQWERISCHMNPVYVTHYIVTHCSVSKQGCQGQPKNSSADNNEDSQVIKDLSAGMNYQVTVLAVSDAGEGPSSDPIRTMVSSKVLDRGTVVGLAVGGAFCLVFLISLVAVCYKVVRKSMRTLTYKIEVPQMKDECEDSNDESERYQDLFFHDKNNHTKRPVTKTTTQGCDSSYEDPSDNGIQNKGFSVRSVTDSPCRNVNSSEEPKSSKKRSDVTKSKPEPEIVEELQMKEIFKTNTSKQTVQFGPISDDKVWKHSCADKSDVGRYVTDKSDVDRYVTDTCMDGPTDTNGVGPYIKIGVSGDTERYYSEITSGSIDTCCKSEGDTATESSTTCTSSSTTCTSCSPVSQHMSVITTWSPESKLYPCIGREGLSDYIPHCETMGKEIFSLGTENLPRGQCRVTGDEETQI